MDEAIDRYLKSRGATLWGRAWDLSQEESKEGARAFIKDLWSQLELGHLIVDEEWLEEELEKEFSTAAPSATGPISTEAWLHPSKSSARTGA